jgi:hypothetical protein
MTAPCVMQPPGEETPSHTALVLAGLGTRAVDREYRSFGGGIHRVSADA